MGSIHEVFAYLRVADATRAIEYYTEAFGAEEKFRLAEPSGRIGHAELAFGDATIMLSDEFPEMGIRGPASVGATTVSIHLHVDDADAVLERAEKAGGEIIRPAQDQFYGERSGTVRDPFGHEWNVGHSIEQVPPEEMQRRYDEMLKR
jgi:uncharacterized glyoxalase superfamily protein PhnB